MIRHQIQHVVRLEEVIDEHLLQVGLLLLLRLRFSASVSQLLIQGVELADDSGPARDLAHQGWLLGRSARLFGAQNVRVVLVTGFVPVHNQRRVQITFVLLVLGNRTEAFL